MVFSFESKSRVFPFQQAELLFHKLGETDGIFLVRKSSRGKNYALTLAFEQHTYHYEIKVMVSTFFFRILSQGLGGENHLLSFDSAFPVVPLKDFPLAPTCPLYGRAFFVQCRYPKFLPKLGIESGV